MGKHPALFQGPPTRLSENQTLGQPLRAESLSQEFVLFENHHPAIHFQVAIKGFYRCLGRIIGHGC